MISVLEVGGTHVTAALVDPGTGRIDRKQRTDIDSSADASTLIDSFVGAVEGLNASTDQLAVAIPGPFDYDEGVGDFEGVAKFGSLKGVHVGRELTTRLGVRATFVNDVTAYAIGQYEALGHPERLVVLALGTGVGSAFLAGGHVVTEGDDIPESGWIYTLEHEGRPVEDSFSRRAIIRAYREAAGRELDVVDIARLAVDGDPVAVGVMQRGYETLALTTAPWLASFRADTLAVGGSISRTWELVERYFIPVVDDFLRRHSIVAPRVAQGQGGENAALIGAALYAVS